MSTDAPQHGRSADPDGGDTAVESTAPQPDSASGRPTAAFDPTSSTPAGATSSTSAGATSSGTPSSGTTAPDLRPADREPRSAPDPDAQEATRVALPAQRSEDGFAEVDGGDADPDGTRTTAFVPTPEEDAALRDERARRFGRPQQDPDPSETSRSTVAAPLAAGAAASASAGTSAGTSGQTQAMPATASSGGTTSTTGTAGTESDDPFSEFDDGPTSRAAAHWWSILISIVFVPVAWYLLTDGGERTAFSLEAGGQLNLAGPVELALGAVCLFGVLLAARWSSVGVIITGAVSFLIGVAFLVVNEQAMDLIRTYQGTVVQALSQVGQNTVDHLLADARTGRTAIYGLVLIMVGVVSHGARRQGRREEKRRAALGL